MAVRVAQSGISKVVTFYKNGDKFFKGYRMAITPRRYRNMETLLNDLTRLLNLPLGARYVLTKTGKTVEDLNEFEHGQGYICSSFPKLKNLRYGAADHLPNWNASKQTTKVKAAQSLKFRSNFSEDVHVATPQSPERDLTRKRLETFKPKIITVIRYGHKPRRSVKVLLNKRTAQTFDQVLNEVTSAIGVWGTNGIRRLYNQNGRRMNDISDLFKEDDFFIAVGNERLQLSDLDDIIQEATCKPSVTKKTRLPSINSVDDDDISQIETGPKSTYKVKRNSVKLPSIGRRINNENKSDNFKANVDLNENKKHRRAMNIDSKKKQSSIAEEPKSSDHTKSNATIETSQGVKDNYTHTSIKKHDVVDKKEIALMEKQHSYGCNKPLESGKLEKDQTRLKPKNMEDVYTIGEKIGDGNFAVVRTGTDKVTKTKYALKIIDRKKIEGKEDMLKNEIRIMKGCCHVNIVRLYDTFETLFDVCLVMELVAGGDLFDEISNSVKFEEVLASSFARDIAKALKYLHQQNIVHRDVKPENLLVNVRANGKKQLKLADFGLAVEVKGPLFTVCGTPTYVAPEILQETGYGLPVDIWAAGVIVYIMLCGFPPFRSPNKDQDELFDLIIAANYEFLSPYWDGVSDKAKDLVWNLLVVDTRQRYKAQQILDHPWLQGDDKVDLRKNVDGHAREPVFNARRKFKGAAIAIKGSRRFQNIAQEFQFVRGEKLIM